MAHPAESMGKAQLELTKMPLDADSRRFDPNGTDRGTSFLELIRNVLETKEDAAFATWYDIDGNPIDEYTFGELWLKSGVVYHYLRHRWGAKSGERVVLCYDFGLDFLVAFLACIRAGVVAVLVYPPGPPLVRSLAKMKKVVDDCLPQFILTDSKVALLRTADKMNPVSKSRRLWPKGIEFKITDKLSVSENFVPPADAIMSPNSVAFLQYTSGSTGDPKGVMITYANLVANVKLNRDSTLKYLDCTGGVPNVPTNVSWLPQYHDMGLVVAILQPLCCGWRLHMTSPPNFIKNPMLWMELVSRSKAHWTVAPDFGYRLVARKYSQRVKNVKDGGIHPFKNLDLSNVRGFCLGAEPMRIDTMDLVNECFAKHGLRQDWLFCAYGIAENVVGVVGVRGFHLSRPRVEGEKTFVATGAIEYLHDSCAFKIVDPETFKEVSGDGTGEVWIAGESKALGYYNKPELSKATFYATIVGDSSKIEYLRTGDLAFLQGGYLYICGRMKDLIISNGVNYYPHDIEDMVEQVSEAVRPGCIAAFSSDDAGGDGSLEIVFEIRSSHKGEAFHVCQAIHAEVSKKIGLAPSRIVAIEERTISKTTSGKIRRRACRSSLHQGQFNVSLDFSQGSASSRIINFLDGKKEKPVDYDSIVADFLGDNCDLQETWENLGLTSIKSIELRDALADCYAITLLPNCFENFPTPEALKTYVLERRGASFPTHLPALNAIESRSVSWNTMGLIQALGSIIMLFLFAIPIIPAYYVGSFASNEGTKEMFSVGGAYVQWLWVPIALPTWMVAFTLSVIASKWVVIGPYREGEVQLPSLAFIRWWFVDRMVELWEVWVGRYVKNTPLMWMVYRMMGAKIHPSAKIDAFVREFDLVNVSKGASIEHDIRCRKFSPWSEQEEGPRIRFRSISVGEDCLVRGMLSPGVSMGKASKCEILSVMPEGAQAEKGVHARGNPAFVSKTTLSTEHAYAWWKLGIVKVVWLVVELYVFYGLLLVAQILLTGSLPTNWRYSKLCHWFLYLVIFYVLSLLGGVILKWILIGRKRPGQYEAGLWRTAADWMVDYHHYTSGAILMALRPHSRFWAILFKLYGLDTDFRSIYPPGIFAPSKVDLISLRESFLPTMSFETNRDGKNQMTRIYQSSLGYNAHVEAGRSIIRSTVPVLTTITEDIVSEKVNAEFSEVSSFQNALRMTTYEILSLGLLFAVFCSLIPAFEVWERLDPQSVEAAVPVLVFSLVIQTTCWVLLGVALHMALHGRARRQSPWSTALFMVYMYAWKSTLMFSMLLVTYGTPLFNMVLRVNGAKVGKRVFYFGDAHVYDAPYITLSDRTVIDRARTVGGHIQVYWDTRFGPCRVSGTVHPGTFIGPNAVVTSDESGPWRAFVATACSGEEKTSHDIEEGSEYRKKP